MLYILVINVTRFISFPLNCNFVTLCKSSSPKVFLWKGAVDICGNYRRTPMPKCEFNKITLRHEFPPVIFLHIFKTPSCRNTSGGMLLSLVVMLSMWARVFHVKPLSPNEKVLTYLFKLWVFGGVDIVIIINNNGGWNNRGVGRGWKNSVGGFLILIC